MENHIIIMAGGVGSRFWPMSTPEQPKQFIDVVGCGKSLLQMTVERLLPLCPIEHFWIATGARYVALVKQQLPDIPTDNILAEPVSRNTAPCIAYACWKIWQRHPDANIVVTPSDALVTDTQEYRRVLNCALQFTAARSAIVTIGIRPSRPETGYGYIAAAERVEGDIHKVESFREKPDIDTAKSYLAKGNYLWNAGIFVWNIATIIAQIHRFRPTLAAKMDAMAPAFFTDKEAATVGRLFPECEKISIDYAVMEKSPDIYTLPAEFGWSDLGSWGSLRALLPQDEAGNAVVGANVELHECSGCIVHTQDNSRVVLQGLHDCIVAQRDGRLLVCSLSEEQRIRDFAK